MPNAGSTARAGFSASQATETTGARSGAPWYPALAAGFTVRFSTLAAALADLLAQDSLPAFERRIRRYTSPDLLILDELGCAPRGANEPRLAARDRFLAPLVAERDAILSANNGDVGAALVALVDRLVGAERTIDRHVWLDAAADLVAPLAPDVRIDLAKRAARRIHTTFALSARDRAHLERALLRRLWPLT